MSRSRHFPLVALSLLVLIAFAARAIRLDFQSLWRDEVDALRFATGPLPELLSRFTQRGWNGPLYFLLLRGWIDLAGTSEYAMRFFSLFFGVLTVPLVYALGGRLFTRPVGVLAALLTASSPYLIWYSQEVKMYTLVPALVLTAIHALHRALAGEGWHWWAVQVLATSLACYSHILAALAIPVQVLLYFAWWPRARRQWRGGLISLACLTLPYLPLLAWQGPLMFEARETGFYPYSLKEMALILLGGWSCGILPPSPPLDRALVAVVAGLAMWGLTSCSFAPAFFTPAAGGKGEALRNGLGLLTWLLIPLLTVGLVSRWQPLFTDRYLIWSAPAFYLLVALGLMFFLRLKAPVMWGGMLLAGVILVFNGVNAWRQVAGPIKSDFRQAAAYVSERYLVDRRAAPYLSSDELSFRIYLPLVSARGASQAPAGELILFQIPYGRYTFDYYFPDVAYPWADGYYTNYRASDGSYTVTEQETARYMREITAGYEAVWLVVTEMEMWDERGLVQAWLDENARRTDEAHFTRVDVYHYVLDAAR